MKMMLWDCSRHKSKVTGLSTRGVGELVVDDMTTEPLILKDVLVAFLTVEHGDGPEAAAEATIEIIRSAKDQGRKNVLVVPFAHLSDQLASMSEGRKLIESVYEQLQKKFSGSVFKEHFGSDKSLSIDLVGHPGNVRFRSFSSQTS